MLKQKTLFRSGEKASTYTYTHLTGFFRHSQKYKACFQADCLALLSSYLLSFLAEIYTALQRRDRTGFAPVFLLSNTTPEIKF